MPTHAFFMEFQQRARLSPAFGGEALAAEPSESRIKIRAFPGAMGGGKGIMGYIMIGITVGALYLAPSFVAYKRRHHSMTGIFFMNFLLGWTFVGWAGALVWAFTKVEPPSEAPEEG